MSAATERSRVESPAEKLPVSIAPESALGRAFGDPAMILYGLMPAVINSVLIPKSARGVEQHERIVNGSIPNLGAEHVLGRFVDTTDLILGTVFAGPEARDAAHAIHELHRKVHGRMPDGTPYHAWNKQTWNHTWLVQVRGLMETYGVLRGYRDEAHRLAVYRGLVEVGRQFRVLDLPETLDGFDRAWDELVVTTLVGSDSARFIAEQTSHAIIKPSKMAWLPTPLWALVTAPIRRIGRVGMLCGLPEELDAELGIHRTRFDSLERRVHQAFWRMIPSSFSSRAGPAYMRLRRMFGNPVWRTRYSRGALVERRLDEAAR
jgi:uncharacterized protein (DUF2236 family)